MPKRSHHKTPKSKTGAFFRKPIVQIGILAIVALVIYLLAVSVGGGNSSIPASEISVDEAYSMYQKGAFVLDVRTQAEWDDFHVPGATLIPLDELASRVNELPRDKPIIVVCRSGHRSQEGRDILLAAGFTQVTCMTGGLDAWKAAGYPIEP